ncbi:MAG: acyl-CoA thioester hydrolase/BAAT C-terminal domain-containing protein [Anaerolineales bacterium]
MIKHEVTENGLVADFFTTASVQPSKAIIMLGGSEGGKSWSRIKRPIELLVKRGYSVLSLAYFKSEGLSSSLEEIPLEYFKKAFDWLSTQVEIVPNEFTILGGSKGSEAALLLGSKYPQVKAVVAFSPSSVIWQGIPTNRFGIGKDIKSSWSCNRVGLPFLPYPSLIKKWELISLRLRKMHEEALQNTEREKESAIHVESIQGAILLISGLHDHLWPATLMSEQIMNRLKMKEFDNHYEHIIFNSGHNGIVMNKDSWRKIFDFLDEHFT